MIGRRGAGLMLIGLGLLAAVVVPVAAGRVIAGSAQAVPVSGPPVVGDCFAEKFDLGWDMPGTDPSKYRYPDLTLSRCSEPHYGEVVSVVAAPTTPKIAIDPGGASMSIDDKNIDTCNQAAERFLGLHTRGNSFPVLYGYWSLVPVPSVVPMTPTAQQRAAGQHWLACATYLADQSASGATLVRYRDSLRNAHSTGVGRNFLGACPAKVDWNQWTSFACLRPHHGEIFGVGGLSRSVARTTLTASCAKLVEQVIKSVTVLGDTGLTIDVQATDATGATIAGGQSIPAQATVQCGLLTTGGRLLKGSLIAIGSAPIPWA